MSSFLMEDALLMELICVVGVLGLLGKKVLRIYNHLCDVG